MYVSLLKKSIIYIFLYTHKFDQSIRLFLLDSTIQIYTCYSKKLKYTINTLDRIGLLWFHFDQVET